MFVKFKNVLKNIPIYCYNMTRSLTIRGTGRSKRGRRGVRRSARVMYVCGQVFGEIVGPGEALAASFTVVGPLARVNAQMTSQVALAAERTPAK